MAEGGPPVFEARGLCKVYRMGEVEVHALRDVDLDLFEGELVVLLGPSGSGKSTLLNILGGLDVPSSGRVRFFEHDLTAAGEAERTRFRREHVGFVFQFYNLIPSLTARENVALVTDIAERPLRPEEALARVGLAERIDHFPAQLSGGEQQRVAIARAIAKRPEVLLCDEPTGALDYATGKLVLEVLEQVNRELGTTTAVITHNAAIAGMADRVIRMRSGQIVELQRKLWRDLWHLRGQMLAIGLVVACGVATVVTTRTAYDSLVVSRAAYYVHYRFGDVFATLKRAPEGLARDVAAIPGVAAVHTRIVFDVTLDVPGLREPATGRLISIPERRVPVLNDLHLRSGRWIERGRRDEVLVSEAFARANGLTEGDVVGAVLNGRWQRLRVVGIALTPEYVYEIRGTDLFPDNRRFGVMWMGRDAMGPAFEMDGAFNDLVLSLAPGASEPAVIARLDRLLERWGGLGAIGREEQISHRFLSDEIAQNRITGTVVPAIFLGVAAFLLNVVLRRLVATQRDQIAVLKAFGYASGAVALHYLALALVAVAGGAAVGSAVGLWWGRAIHALYQDFYRFAVWRFEAGAETFALAVGVAALSALVGALGAVRAALALPPAEAMRPEAPARFRAGALERLGLRHLLTPAARMIVRNLARRPGRAALATLGMALAVGLLVVGRFFMDSVQTLADVQFRVVQRDDATVAFHEPLPARARFDAWHLPGVLRAEPWRAVPARLRFEQRSKRVAILGLEPGSELRRLVDDALGEVPLPPAGLLLTARLGEILGVRPGDEVMVEVLEGERARRPVRVAGFVDELMGLSAYMDAGALARLMREQGSVSGAWLRVDAAAQGDLYAELKHTPAVAGVMLKGVLLKSFEDTLARSLGIFNTVLVSFSCVIAFAMVYNAARIALSERARELSSLRVLGFTQAEVAWMLLGEQAILTLLAIPFGLGIGYMMAAWMVERYQWELFRLPLVVSARTCAFAVLVIVLAALTSGLVVGRRLARLDLVAVLKTRE